MKKILAVLLAAVVLLPQLTLPVMAADNPLLASDRITAEINELRKRQEDIINQRKSLASASKALVDFGKTLGETDNLSFYINRKYLTKREYEAFKWSFIFSQFAHPLEDSLLDVFQQEYFQQMIEQDFSIESVQNTIINKGLAASTDNAINKNNVGAETLMLQDVNFEELTEVITANYALYPLYDNSGNMVSFDYLINGDAALYEPFYIYDTIASTSSVSAEELNALLYNQNTVTDIDKKYADKVNISNPEDTSDESGRIPILFYDASTYLYMQLACTAYMKNHNIDNINEVINEYSDYPLMVDSYGNICVATSSSSAAIFIPNFGNTVLTCVESTTDDDVYLDSKIDLYNAWFTSMYTHETRESTTIYPTTYSVHIKGETNRTADSSTGAYTEASDKIMSVSTDHYGSYIGVGIENSLANTFVLVENSMLSPNLGDLDKNIVGDITGDTVPLSHSIVTEKYGKNVATNLKPAVVGTLGDDVPAIFGFSHTVKDILSLFDNEYGLLLSPYNTHASCFAPFTATSDSDYFKNEYPLFQDGIYYLSLRGDSNANAAYSTIYNKLGATLTNASWKYSKYGSHVTTLNSSWLSTNTVGNDASGVASINSCVSLMSSLTGNQLVPDLRFCSFKHSQLSDGSRTVIFLPTAPLDLGQEMSAYTTSIEKGMFNAKYDVFFSGDMDVFKEYITSALNDIILSWSNRQIDFDHSIVKINNGNITLDTDKTGKLWFGLAIVNQDLLSQDFFEFAYEQDSEKVTRWFLYKVIDDDDDANDEATYKFFDTQQTDENLRYIDTYYFATGITALYPDIDNDSLSGTGTKYECDTEYDEDAIENVKAGLLSLDDICTAIISVKAYEGMFNGISADEIKAAYGNAKVALVDFAYQILGKRILNATKNNEYSTESGFRKILSEACQKCGFNSEDYYHMLINILRFGTSDGGNVYFYDEYTYLLKNGTQVSSTIGCKNTDDFVNCTYFWDRHYLAEAQFNKDLCNYIESQYSPIKDTIDKYENYLKTNFLTSLNYSFSKWLEDNPDEGNISTQIKQKYPYIHEYSLQVESFAEWKTKNSAIASILSDSESLYEYLADDTIVLYPFGWDEFSNNICLYTGIGDAMYVMSSGTSDDEIKEIASSQMSQQINPIRSILALQKNTDYKHNNLKYTYTKKETTTHVTREELMDKANAFFENPVSSLSYIFTGFLYQVHETLATGELGSVFSINYLLETDVYKWIMNRYIAIVTIALAVILLLKLIQFAMNKSKDFMHIGKSIVGILAMCMVPIIVFNSFVWAFDATSSWAFSGVKDKVLLSQLDSLCKNDNGDANVNAEMSAFKEQFSQLKGEYDGLQIQQMTNYSLDSGSVYTTVPISDMVQNLKFSTLDSRWYTPDTFRDIHKDKYSESYFYYFYDYIKYEFLNYCSTHSTESTNQFKDILAAYKTYGGKLGTASTKQESATAINAAENAFRTMTGNFRQMLMDTSYVYKNSIQEELQETYGGPQVADLVGLYYIFDTGAYKTHGASFEFIDILQNSVTFKAYQDSPTMKASSDALISETWINQTIISDYFTKQKPLGKGIRGSLKNSQGTYSVFTSGLDAFNESLNTEAANTSYKRTETSPILTPLEKTLIQVTESIYDKTLIALNYLPDQIHDETAITLMAYIATFELNKAMGYEATEPLAQSIYLDNVIRTAFLTDLSDIDGDTNTLYAMIQQGDGIGKVSLVVCLELVISVASIFRVLIIIYITIASFIILALRLLHKAPRTTDLVYGIVGNVLALLFLHALTLFLVVIAVEWVANATSALPDFVLCLLMILFVILVSYFLFRLVKNIIKDAINLGGSKIKAGVHKITNAIMHVAGRFTSGQNDLEAEIAEINVQQGEVRKELSDSLKESAAMREEQVIEVSRRLREAEAAEAAEEKQSDDTNKNNGTSLSESRTISDKLTDAENSNQ